MMWWGGSVGGVLMLVFWVVVLLLVVLAVRALFPSEHGGERESALAVLKRRYAAGEISQAEYEQARRTIAETGSQV